MQSSSGRSYYWKITLRNSTITAVPLILLPFLAIAASTLIVFLQRSTAADMPRLIVNPYETVDWENVTHFKLNLHTHTTESDGHLSPAQVIDEYHERGYNGLAITDHDRNTWPWIRYDRDPEALGMLAIPGNELSRHHHALSLFTTYETEESDLDAALAGVAEADGLAILCHPAMHWLRNHDTPGLQISLTSPLRQITQGDFAVEAWFRTTDPGRHILLGNYSDSYSGALNLELHTDNRVRVFVQPHGDGRTVDLNVSADDLGIDTRDGEWHHLAATRRGDAIFLYLDGKQAGKGPDSAGKYNLQGDFLYIGRDSRTGSTVYHGDLFQARLWRRAFTDEEAAALAAGVPVAADGLVAQYAVSNTVGEDVAGNPDGPFHAVATGAPPLLIGDMPNEAQATGAASNALQFGEGTFPRSVPDAVAADFAALFRRHPHLHAVEVLNRTRPEREYPLDRELWDRLLSALMPERPVWGVAVDDMHRIQHLGGDWVVIPTAQLDESTARDALESGAYYFASTRLHAPDVADVVTTPRIDRITHDARAGTIRVSASVAGESLSDSAYVWISDGSTIHTGPELSYHNTRIHSGYARLEIMGGGGTTFTNPFGFPARTTGD